MVFGLTDTTEKNHENLKKIYDFQKKNEDLSAKLLEQYQLNKEFETEIEEKRSEIEKLKKQIQEMDYSFVKPALNNDVVDRGSIKPEHFGMEASSIMQKDD